MENTIKVERAILNLTQEDLAQKIGVSRQVKKIILGAVEDEVQMLPI